jgi:hypothetical protein
LICCVLPAYVFKRNDLHVSSFVKILVDRLPR